jgi:hypothetical protein
MVVFIDFDPVLWVQNKLEHSNFWVNAHTMATKRPPKKEPKGLYLLINMKAYLRTQNSLDNI